MNEKEQAREDAAYERGRREVVRDAVSKAIDLIDHENRRDTIEAREVLIRALAAPAPQPEAEVKRKRLPAYELPIGTEIVIGKRRWRLIGRASLHPDHMFFRETTGKEIDPLHRTMYPSEVQWLLDQGCGVLFPLDVDPPDIEERIAPQTEASEETPESAFVRLLNELRQDEGTSITILCPNPDGPPDEAIEVTGPWTGWESKRYEGESVLQAVAKALTDKQKGT